MDGDFTRGFLSTPWGVIFTVVRLRDETPRYAWLLTERY